LTKKTTKKTKMTKTIFFMDTPIELNSFSDADVILLSRIFV